ncbi:MAG: hypothetical protein GX786_04000, partial [Clostridiales bacterium]|nr:hypothetical protein [Clostridiales bacterium]
YLHDPAQLMPIGYITINIRKKQKEQPMKKNRYKVVLFHWLFFLPSQ